MAFEDDGKKVAAISYGLGTPFWQDYLLPEMQAKAKNFMEGLAAAPSDQDDIKRGWIQALRWVIRMPEQEVAEYHKIEEARAQEARLDNLDEHRARYGNRSPYPTPVPGELTGEESGGSTP